MFQINRLHKKICYYNFIGNPLLRMQLWPIICLGLYFIIFLHLIVANNGGMEGDSLPWVIIGGLFSWLVIMGICFLSPSNIQWEITPCLKWFAIACILLTLPLVWCPNYGWFFHALPRILGLWSGFIGYFMLLQCHFNSKQWVLIFSIIGFGALIQAIFVLFEIFLPSLVPELSRLVIQNGKFGYGVFQQKNVTASYLVTGLSIFISLFSFYKKPLSLKNLLLPILGFSILSLTTSVVLLNSRIGWLSAFAVIVCFLCFISFYPITYISVRRKIILALLILSGVLIGIALSSLLPTGLKAEHTFSNHQRLLTLFYSMKMLSESPWLGWGYGGYEYFFQHWLSEQRPSPQTLELMNHPHNEILFLVIEGGIAPLIAIIIFMCAGFYLTFIKHSVPKIIASIVLLPILLHTQVEYPLYLSSTHWMIVIIILAYLDSYNVTQKHISSTKFSHFSIRYVIGFVAVYSVFSMCIALYNEVKLTEFERRTLADDASINSLFMPWLANDRYVVDLALLELVNYDRTGEVKYLYNYIDRVHVLSLTTLNADLFYNLIKVERFVSENNQASTDSKEAKKIFPYDDRF